MTALTTSMGSCTPPVNANDIRDGSLRAYRTDTPTFRQTGVDHFVARRVYVGLVKRFSP